MPLDKDTRVGDYVIDSLLGAGGMGEVYKAYDERLRRLVALKFLLARPGDVDLGSRLRHEARAAASLDHPFICKVYEVGESGSATFIAMEYIAGGTLAARLAAGAPPPAVALRFAIEIAEALTAAHRGGIVHRDLKPSNIMVGDDGHVRVLDFGLASRQGADARTTTTDVSTTGGTLAYMAPEQLRGQPGDEKSDIFAFGIVLAELLTGRHPFHGVSGIDIATAIASPEPWTWPEAVAAPELVRHVVRKALAKSRDERYASASDLLIDLRAVESDSRGRAALPALATRRRLTTRSLAFAVVAGIAALGISGVWLAPLVRRGLGDPLAAPAFAQVTTDGHVISADISPDGRSVAYIVDDDATRRLLVRDLSGGPSLTLVEAIGLNDAAWLPDGTRISYSEPHGGFEVARLGGAPRPSLRLRPLAWSPDATRAAVVSPTAPSLFLYGADGQQIGDPVPVPGAQRLRGVDWNRGTPLLLLFGIDEQSRETIWTANADGTDFRVVHVDSEPIVAARWSPMAARVFFLRARAQTMDLVVFDLDRPEQLRVLASGLPMGGTIRISGDGRRVLHVRGQVRANLAEWSLADPAKPPRAITRGTGYLSQVDLSPDGRWILAVSGDGATTSIVKVPTVGGEPVAVTDGTARDQSPAWSPDGTRVLFASNRGGGNGVWILDENGHLQQVANAAPSAQLLAAWAPDGRVMWQRDTTPPWSDYQLRDLVSGREETLAVAKAEGLMFRPRFAPGGGRVAVYWARRPYPRTGLWVIDLPSRDEKMLAPFLWPIGWSHEGDAVFAAPAPSLSDPAPGIYRVTAGTGESRLWATVPGGRVLDAVIAHDGQSLVASVAERSGDAWLIDLATLK